MKALDVLEVLSRESVSSEQFGVVYVNTPMLFADFVKIYMWHDFKRRGTCDDIFISGAVFYCWSDTLLDFFDSDDVDILDVNGSHLYLIQVE